MGPAVCNRDSEQPHGRWPDDHPRPRGLDLVLRTRLHPPEPQPAGRAIHRGRSRAGRNAAAVTRADRAAGAAGRAGSGSAEPAPAAAPQVPQDLPLEQARLRATSPSPDSGAAPGAPAKTRRQRALERRLSGTVFARESPVSATSAAADRPTKGGDGALTELLSASATPAAQARVLPTRTLFAPQGRVHRLHLGDRDRFDASRHDHLHYRRRHLRSGRQGRVARARGRSWWARHTDRCCRGRRGCSCCGRRRVLLPASWCRWIRRAPMSSGGRGFPGRCSTTSGSVLARRCWCRSSTVRCRREYRRPTAPAGGAVIYTPSGSQEVLTEVLKDTLHIAPTIVKRNGDRIQVLVARDVDFRSVYELRASTTGR